jgi:uncharacterized protein (DUF4415 family)
MTKSGTKSSELSMAGKSLSSARSTKRGAGLSQRGAHREKSGKNITIMSRNDARRGTTDWGAVEALTDKQIEAAIREDPDAVPLDFDWSEAVLVIPPRKKAISIRLDEDVLDFFKRDGAGYQRRMNAVLRSYMQQKRKKRA